ncbi:MAG: EDSAP-1 family PEP-CTERM protein, partial [Telluria sp.]
AGAAMGNAGMASATTFLFELGADEFMTISFDAFAFTEASAVGAQNQQHFANAQLAWTISVLDVTSGAVVFTFQPEELNAMSNVSRSTGLAGASSYDPGWMAFSATIGVLTGGTVYNVSISQSTSAIAIGAQQMPEPGTLSAIGAGLLAMATLSRRRRR